MKKKYIVLVILVILSSVLFYKSDIFLSKVKQYLPQTIKTTIKEFFVGKETLSDLKKFSRMNYNQKLLPKVEFTNMNFKEVFLNDLEDISNKFFMELFEDKLIIIDNKGKTFFIKKKFITNSESLNWTKVNTNLNPDNVRITDVLVLKNEIYISYQKLDLKNECNTVNISKASLLNKKLNFEIFFTSSECIDFKAGRMASYNHNGKEGILLTTNSFCNVKELAQDNNSLIGKILFIELETSNYIIFSKGHRNPQGLTTVNNLILSAEHGPTGGDEINLIQFGQNYGWPISSYGEPDNNCSRESSRTYEYFKSHSKYGFIEPIYAFVPSIGINQIIEVPDNFSEYWKNNFLVTSLANGTIYRILLDKNYEKLFYHEKIFIGKRMRDIIYSDEFNVFLIALEGEGKISFPSKGSYGTGKNPYPSIGILSN